jgi:hypothetical protein
MYFVSFPCGFRYNYWTIPVLFEVPYPEANGNDKETPEQFPMVRFGPRVCAVTDRTDFYKGLRVSIDCCFILTANASWP